MFSRLVGGTAGRSPGERPGRPSVRRPGVPAFATAEVEQMQAVGGSGVARSRRRRQLVDEAGDFDVLLAQDYGPGRSNVQRDGKRQAGAPGAGRPARCRSSSCSRRATDGWVDDRCSEGRTPTASGCTTTLGASRAMLRAWRTSPHGPPRQSRCAVAQSAPCRPRPRGGMCARWSASATGPACSSSSPGRCI